MAELNLKAQLDLLIQLQSVDSQIYTLKEDKSAKPEEMKALDAAFEAKKQKLAELEKNSLDLQKQKKEKDLELAAKDEATKKLQSQLYSLKTNKEYQTMLQQISDSKADYSVIEDRIITLFDQIDKIKQEIEQEKKVLQEQEKSFQEEKKRIEARIKEIDGKLAQVEVERKRIIPGLDPKILQQYEKILENRQGLAIVGVANNSCLGCNMFVPPQVINLIKMYERVITCEVCNRMLYVNDDQT
ncbi:MAG: C4-type zinc ribbon domain-containing protein [Candidatus Omnitrophica bacterium]|nr:C4-type zinc ribbon domain-containing protein [Candidatus Omnitrophota bacterium]